MLKEKGFDVPCSFHYTERWKEKPTHGLFKSNGFYEGGFTAPEQWQVVEWLRVEKGIWIEISSNDNFTFQFQITNWKWDEKEKSHRVGTIVLGKTLWETRSNDFNSPQEAYSAAFDYILKNLI